MSSEGERDESRLARVQGSKALPPRAHLLTLQYLDRDAVLLRLAHIYQANEIAPTDASDTGQLPSTRRVSARMACVLPRNCTRLMITSCAIN